MVSLVCVPRTKVLVVDDDPVTSRVLERLLRRRGLDVLATLQANSALKLMREHQPTLVLMDVRMPGIQGTSLVRLIRDDPALASTIVILYSSLSEEALDLEAAQCGADGSIAKSRGIVYLEQNLDRWLRRLG